MRITPEKSEQLLLPPRLDTVDKTSVGASKYDTF
jgi:hypothetical protein